MSDSVDDLFEDRVSTSDLRRKTVGGGILIGLAQAAKGILSFVGFAVILPRLLAPEEFGVVGMVVAAIGFFGMFRDMGMSQATVQRKRITHDQVTVLFWLNVAFSLAVAVVMAVLAPVLAWFYGETKLVGITLVLAASGVLGGLGIQHRALLRRLMRFDSLALIEIAALLLQLTTSIVLAVAGFGYWSLVAGRVAVEASTLLGAWLACDWRPGLPRGGDGVRSMVNFGGNVTGFNVVNYFARNLDDILVGRFSGSGPLGLYQKAYEILLLPLDQVNRPVGRVALPALSKIVDDSDRYRTVYLRILEMVLLATVPVATFFLTSADLIVPLVLGERWAPASPIVMAMALVMFVQPLGNSTGWLFMSQDRTPDMFRWGMVGSTIVVVAFWIGIPWGPLGVALAYAVVDILVRTPLLLWWVGRRGPVRTRDFYVTAAPFMIAGLAGILVVEVAQRSWVLGPLPGVLSALVLSIATTVLVVALWPRGRRVLVELPRMVRELRRG